MTDRSGTRRRRFGALVLLFGLGVARPGAAEPVALELVLAVDVSSSVDRVEHDLQMTGIAEAFRDPLVQAAIRGAGAGGVAVTLMQWSGLADQVQSVPWTRLLGDADAEAFANRVAAAGRLPTSGGTAIGQALDVAAGLFAGSGYQGRRRVIDVSGDGRDNTSVRPESVRDRLVAAGLTINGLAILKDWRGRLVEAWSLRPYYREHVVGGPGAFLMTARDYRDFADAIRAKLLREIGGAPVAAAPPRVFAADDGGRPR